MIELSPQALGRTDHRAHPRLVNNAGISLEANGPPARVHETSDEIWDITMAVNVRSVFLASKHTLKQMLAQQSNENNDRGWIINISSIFGLIGGRFNCTMSLSHVHAGADSSQLPMQHPRVQSRTLRDKLPWTTLKTEYIATPSVRAVSQPLTSDSPDQADRGTHRYKNCHLPEYYS